MKKLYLRIRRSEYLLMILGTAIMAVSANIFFSPAGMVPGGFTGLAMLIERLTAGFPHGGIPLWLGNVLLNDSVLIFQQIFQFLVLEGFNDTGFHFVDRDKNIS